MDYNSRIFVTHDHDMIGNGIVRSLKRQGYHTIITCSEQELDLKDEAAVSHFFEKEKPEYVFCFAGPHGGIIRNVSYPADLCYENLKIQCSVMNAAKNYNVKRLMFMTGNCAYPVGLETPIKESSFMDGKMEPTSAAYSTARAAGIEMCWAYNRQYKTNFFPAILTNYYGQGDDFSNNGHVLASVLHKMHMAKKNNESELILWGSGNPKRQFMYIDDMADGIVLAMNKYKSTELINIAGGHEFSIKEMSEKLKKIIGYTGSIVFDTTKPDGAMRKLLDNTKLITLGFQENISFEDGLQLIYQDYLNTGGFQ